MLFWPRIAAALAFLIVQASPIWAKESPGENRQPSSGEGKKAESKIDTENLFGFTSGSDVGEPGEREVSLNSMLRLGRRGGHYGVFSSRLEGQYVPTDNFSFAFGATFDRYSIRNVPELEDRETGGLSQLSTELRYRFIKRDPSPVGLTLSLRPQLGFFDRDTGERATRTALEARLELDTELVPELVFGAMNLIYEPERIRPSHSVGSDLGAVQNESRVGVSGAVSTQLVPNLFVGAEARYLRQYEGLAFQSFQGHALFFGPTFYAKISESVSVSAAWNVQVAGRATDDLGNLDLQNFERHQARIRLKVSF